MLMSAVRSIRLNTWQQIEGGMHWNTVDISIQFSLSLHEHTAARVEKAYNHYVKNGL